MCVANICREVSEVLEIRLGGEVGQEKDAQQQKKSPCSSKCETKKMGVHGACSGSSADLGEKSGKWKKDQRMW